MEVIPDCRVSYEEGKARVAQRRSLDDGRLERFSDEERQAVDMQLGDRRTLDKLLATRNKAGEAWHGRPRSGKAKQKRNRREGGQGKPRKWAAEPEESSAREARTCKAKSHIQRAARPRWSS